MSRCRKVGLSLLQQDWHRNPALVLQRCRAIGDRLELYAIEVVLRLDQIESEGDHEVASAVTIKSPQSCGHLIVADNPLSPEPARLLAHKASDCIARAEVWQLNPVPSAEA
jgi:hypothetical protein